MMEYYRLVNTKTHNTVYITNNIFFTRKKDGSKENKFVPVIAMCGYGPHGKSSRWYARRSLRKIKDDIKILVNHPRRKKDLANLQIEKFDDNGNILRTHSMARFVSDIEQEMIIEKLRA